jgi:hypothetical protein
VKTEELIVQLARAAKPVARLRRPAIRLSQWLTWALLVGGGAVLIIGARADFRSALGVPAYAASLLMLMAVVTGAAGSALVLAVPGAERSPLRRWWPVAGCLAWALGWIALAATAPPRGTASGLFHAACALEIAVLATVAGYVLFKMVVRGAPLRRTWVGVTVSVAALACGAAAAQVICPIDDPVHHVLSHVLVGALVGVAGALTGRRHLRRIGRVTDLPARA